MKTLLDTGQMMLTNSKVAVTTGPGAYPGNIANTMTDRPALVGLNVCQFESVSVPISGWGPTLAKLRADPSP